MAHHVGDQAVSADWALHCNNLIAPGRRGSTPRPSPACACCRRARRRIWPRASRELRRCVEELGFVGCNLNPDPGGGHFTHPPLTDRILVPDLRGDVRARRAGDDPRLGQLQPGDARHRRLLHRRRHHRLHAAAARATCSAASRLCASSYPTAAARCHSTGAATAASPTCSSSPSLDTHLMNNVFFDTCVYHQPGVNLLAEVIDDQEHPVRQRDGRRGARDRSADRALFRRHQALRRRPADQSESSVTRSSRATPAGCSRGSTPSSRGWEGEHLAYQRLVRRRVGRRGRPGAASPHDLRRADDVLPPARPPGGRDARRLPAPSAATVDGDRVKETRSAASIMASSSAPTV